METLTRLRILVSKGCRSANVLFKGYFLSFNSYFLPYMKGGVSLKYFCSQCFQFLSSLGNCQNISRSLKELIVAIKEFILHACEVNGWDYKAFQLELFDLNQYHTDKYQMYDFVLALYPCSVPFIESIKYWNRVMWKEWQSKINRGVNYLQLTFACIV